MEESDKNEDLVSALSGDVDTALAAVGKEPQGDAGLWC